MSHWHKERSEPAGPLNYLKYLVEWRLARRLLVEALRMWNQPAQSPFRRFAAAQVSIIHAR